MSTIREQFVTPKKFKTWSYALMGAGILAIILLYATTRGGATPDEKAHNDARFWGALLHNSVYFLLIVNASMFFMCATTLAWGGWQMAFRRVPEAISSVVPVIGVIAAAILLVIAFGPNHTIYHWADTEHVKHDKILLGKSGFLNKGFFAFMTVATIIGWTLLGWKMRKLSRELDENPLPSKEAGRKYIFKNTVWAALYMIVFALTVMSSIPWLWLMSIDAHWYSTMYSWYTFASSWVAGISLIMLFVVYLKNQGYLEYVNEEHIHDLGKFMFAFSVFWTYLWYSQYMLIWYANIPEETKYFEPRQQGIYRGLFILNLIINFLAPFLLLMRRGSKRNYTMVVLVAVLIIFGHWLDFFQMVFPAISQKTVPVMLLDFGIALGFVGIIMYFTALTLSKHPLLAKNHPFVKESIIHHT